MKSLLRTYTWHLVALYFVSLVLAPGFSLGSDVKSVMIAAGILTLLNLLVRPILNLLFLPIHALTLGFFSIVINAGIFYAFTKVSPGVVLGTWTFSGISRGEVNIPALTFGEIGTLIIASILVLIITKFLAFLVE